MVDCSWVSSSRMAISLGLLSRDGQISTGAGFKDALLPATNDPIDRMERANLFYQVCHGPMVGLIVGSLGCAFAAAAHISFKDFLTRHTGERIIWVAHISSSVSAHRTRIKMS